MLGSKRGRGRELLDSMRKAQAAVAGEPAGVGAGAALPTCDQYSIRSELQLASSWNGYASHQGAQAPSPRWGPSPAVAIEQWLVPLEYTKACT